MNQCIQRTPQFQMRQYQAISVVIPGTGYHISRAYADTR